MDAFLSQQEMSNTKFQRWLADLRTMLFHPVARVVAFALFVGTASVSLPGWGCGSVSVD